MVLVFLYESRLSPKNAWSDVLIQTHVIVAAFHIIECLWSSSPILATLLNRNIASYCTACALLTSLSDLLLACSLVPPSQLEVSYMLTTWQVFVTCVNRILPTAGCRPPEVSAIYNGVVLAATTRRVLCRPPCNWDRRFFSLSSATSQLMFCSTSRIAMCPAQLQLRSMIRVPTSWTLVHRCT